jgi:hypothetical protein
MIPLPQVILFASFFAGLFSLLSVRAPYSEPSLEVLRSKNGLTRS